MRNPSRVTQFDSKYHSKWSIRIRRTAKAVPDWNNCELPASERSRLKGVFKLLDRDGHRR